VPTKTSNASAIQEMKEALGDILILDPEVLGTFNSDFGRHVDHPPLAVARCSSAEQVAALVRLCRERGVPIAPRGQGHSQSGQSTADQGIVLDMSSLSTIHTIDPEAETATVGGGVVWRALVEATLKVGMVPRVLTNNLNVSVGGTLSMAGLGVASFRYGTQADNAVELEVVTGAGEIVICSREHNRDLFDVVRCGLGQFGVITKATVRLRHCKSRVRKYFLVYDDLNTIMDDMTTLMAKGNTKFDSLESWCTPCLQGIRHVGEGMELGVGVQTFAYWLFPLHLTIDFEPGAEPDDEAALEGLHFYKKLGTDDLSMLEFCCRMDPVFELWRRSGYWDMPHPWMETILPWEASKEFITQVLAQTPPQALGPGGHILLWPAAGHTSDVPLFKRPEGDFVMGWGILPGVPRKFLPLALGQLDMASELSIFYGGKRYLSGYITFDTPERWAQHFGDHWPMMQAAKRRYDPDGIMAPGFIQFT
jgi:cytokinin dehydrogenase